MPSASAAFNPKRPDMARRTYLQRVAEPLRAGDPVLFAVPHAPPDEARPAANPIITPASPRAAALSVSRRAEASLPITQPQAPSAQGQPRLDAAPPAVSPEIAASGVQAPSERRSEDGQDPPLPVRLQPPAPTDRTRVDIVDAMRLPGEPLPSVATPDFISTPDSGAVEAAARSQAAASPAPRMRSPEPAAQPQARLDDPVHPAQPGPATTAARDPAPAPRLHIGTIEVRASAPQAPPMPQPAVRAAPSRQDAAPLSRAYGWRFGLVQG